MPHFAPDEAIEEAAASENPLGFLVMLLLEELEEKSPARYEEERVSLVIRFMAGAAACFDLMMKATKAESDQASMEMLSRISYSLEVFGSTVKSLEAVSKASKSSKQHPN